jgi:hypothetical protein
MPPIIEAAPARCREKIAQSIVLLLCPKLDKGGYTVHPQPALPPTTIEKTIIIRAGNINQ